MVGKQYTAYLLVRADGETVVLASLVLSSLCIAESRRALATELYAAVRCLLFPTPFFMAIEVKVYPTMPGRPCRYCLALQGGAVFADFDIDDGKAYLVRVSFDGYGCCTVDDSIRKMNSDDSSKFIEMIDSKNVVQDELSSILSRYFRSNTDVIWKDALAQHGLL